MMSFIKDEKRPKEKKGREEKKGQECVRFEGMEGGREE